MSAPSILTGARSRHATEVAAIPCGKASSLHGSCVSTVASV
jgi:hypothetical protein